VTRYKKFIEANVYDEAKRRLHHIYDTHDSVVVAFSGGKDSTVLLHLTHEVALERGIDTVHAVFRDEELINQSVVDFVAGYRELPWLDLRWWTVPLVSNKYVLGVMMDYIQWDPNRKWIRPKPPWGLNLEDLDLDPELRLSQFDADVVTVSGFPGKACILTGIRSDESLMRFRSVVNKMNENYIVASSTPRATMGRPIYDWSEDDVFKYLYDNRIPYCPIYDSQLWGGSSLRVSSAIHTEVAKRFAKHRETDPELYDRVLEVFPEMILQERYYKELDREAIWNAVTSWGEIAAWIDENITDPRQYTKAVNQLKSVKGLARVSPDLYPLPYVMKCFMNTGGHRDIMPLIKKREAK
jgi:predicted phosphoadenosine phosphosulfate sulfurtransferase